MTQALAIANQRTALAAVYEQTGTLPPAIRVAMATDWANNLMELVEKRKLYQTIQGKRYLQVEAWELIGAFDDCTANTRYEPIEEAGEVVGYKGIATLIRRGEQVGGAEASCYTDANVTKGRQGRNKDRAAQSAAQTFAVSKAFRVKYSFVAVLAGFEPTPAEEMVIEHIEHGAPKPKAAPQDQPRARTTPEASPRDKLSDLNTLSELAQQLGWEKDQTYQWLDDNGYRVAGVIHADAAIPALRAMVEAEA